MGAPLLIVALALALGTSQAPAQEVSSPDEPVFTGETFVAVAQEETLIVVILGPSTASQPTRPARAFVCDQQRLGLWFSGDLVDDEFTLLPEERADAATPPPETRLTGTVGAGRVTGDVTLAGQTFPYMAAPATGVGGYWEGVRISGTVLGAASTGAHFLGEEPRVPTATAEGPRYQIDGSVTMPDGAVLPLTLSAGEQEEAIFRTVVLNDGCHCLLH